MDVWQPLGFGNVFDYPSLTPVTPLVLKQLGATTHIVEFHRQLFLAILARNDITTGQMNMGYWMWAGGVELTGEQLGFYLQCGVPVS